MHRALSFLKGLRSKDVILTLVGICIGVFSTWYFTGRKSERYAVSNSYLYVVGQRDQDLKVFWKDRQIKQAYLTFVQLWNNGNQPIAWNDVPEESPVYIKAKGAVHFLYAKAAEDQPKLGLKAIVEGDAIRVSWHGDEVIEPGNGGVVRIIYESSKPTSFFMEGRVKGTGGFAATIAKPEMDRSAGYIVGLVCLITMAVGLFLLIRPAYGARRAWNLVSKFPTADEYVGHVHKQKTPRIIAGVWVLIGLGLLYSVYRTTFVSPGWGAEIIRSESSFR